MSTRDYEAMFLLDNTAATADFEETAAQVDKILEKHGASIVQKEKWDERRLAYEIKGHRRATYYLVYFTAAPSSITEIDNDVALNEVILRHLVVALEEPIADHIQHRAEDREKMAEESRRSSLSGWGERKGRDRGDRERRRESRSDDDRDDSDYDGNQDAEPGRRRVAVSSAETGSDESGSAD